MEWIETPESSNIVRYRYDEETLTLEVEFKNGNIYQYFDVPAGVVEELDMATSKGQYFNQNIRDAFRYART